ncbi:hypothetical protein [Pseudoxanthomonas sp. GW2]|uniref:hypothetical protein n=1 Tax=Pseudoxanthomonas sp. GW2 TaxID=1211114 RepID=UPI0002DB3B86|nr:hypothetical protein [Pseudoxanthomonas sp. GW2]
MSTVVHLPSDVRRFHAGLDAVRQRARQLGCTPERRRLALQTLLEEMRAGRSSGAAVALANSTLRDYPASGWAGGAA